MRPRSSQHKGTNRLASLVSCVVHHAPTAAGARTARQGPKEPSKICTTAQAGSYTTTPRLLLSSPGAPWRCPPTHGKRAAPAQPHQPWRPPPASGSAGRCPPRPWPPSSPQSDGTPAPPSPRLQHLQACTVSRRALAATRRACCWARDAGRGPALVSGCSALSQLCPALPCTALPAGLAGWPAGRPAGPPAHCPLAQVSLGSAR
jgi:hypothetical protein